jgi:hypothetical protein
MPTSVPSVAVATRPPRPAATATTAPTPTPTAIAYGPVSVVSGIENCDLSEGTVTSGPGDTQHSRGGTVECVDRANDPRVSGTFTGTWLSDRWGSPIPSALVQWGTARLVNAGGAWEGRFTGVYSANRGDIITYWWTGTGGYAGLSYFSQTTGTSPWPITGQIFPGDPPNPARTPPVPVATPEPTATASPARASSPTPTAVAYGPVTVVTGTATCPGLDFNWTTDPDGTWRVRDDYHADRCRVTTDDPRVTGVRSSTWNFDLWGNPSAGIGAGVQWGTPRLENDGGAWEGRATGVVSLPGRGDVIVNWYMGTGGYEGLAYFELWTGSGPWTIQGQLFPGSPPTS